MTRRTLLATLAAAAITLVMALAGTTGTATAQQNPNCCIYTVDINLPTACITPGIKMWTRWSNGVFGPQVFFANGTTVFPVPGGCPPAANFIGASLAGPGGPWAMFGAPLQFNVNGCCMVVRTAFDANGCPIIYVRPC
jgi:hypothetical protein